MATSKNSAEGTSTRTAAEMKKWYEENKKNIENFAIAQEAWKQLRDVTKSTKIKTINQVTKENVLSYLQNPSSNETNLRKVSDYLYYRSHIYMRLIDFYAGMVMPSARTVIPEYDIVKDTDVSKNLKAYQQTIDAIGIMNLDLNAKTIWTYCLKEDVYFGVYWLDDTGFTLINIPAEYGRIDGVYTTGNYSWSMDMSFFRSHKELLEYWGEPFESLYREYENDRIKWKQIPPEHSAAFKFRTDDPELVMPVFAGLFAKFADLEDMSDYEAIQAAQDIYKLIWMELETISGSKNVDDFKVDVTMANEYFQKMVNDALPDYTAAALVPGKLNTIEFDDDAATQTSKYEKAMESILNTAGAAQVLCGSAITTSAAFEAAMIASERFALTTLLPQFSGWIEMVLGTFLSKACKVIFHMVSPYTKDKFMDKLLTGSQNGLPDVLTWNSINGFSEKDTLALNALQSALGIPDKFKPLTTSYTQSGNADGYTSEIGQGAPEKDATELTKSGETDRNNK